MAASAGPTRRGWNRRAMIGAAVAPALLLSGCVVEPTRRGAVVPTPTLAGPAIDPAGAWPPDAWRGRTLRVAMAGDSVAAAITHTLLTPFAGRTGCAVEIGYVDIGALFDRASDADLVLVSDRWQPQVEGAGGLRPLEWRAADGAVPDLAPPVAGGVPAYVNALVSTWRVDAARPGRAPSNWPSWWQPRAIPGARSLAKGAWGTFEVALLADQVDPGDLYPLDLARAVASLRRISGSVVDRWWETGPQVIDWLGSGRAAFASAFAHDVTRAQRGGRPLQSSWAQALSWVDYWSVPVGAANADVADGFLTGALSAVGQAALADGGGLAPVSTAALGLLDPVVRWGMATDPANSGAVIAADSAWWVANQVEAEDAFNTWLLGDPRGRG